MKVIHYAVILALICIASALGVAGTFRLTQGRIEQKAKEGETAARAEALAVAKDATLNFEVLNPNAADLDKIMKATDADGVIVGFVALGEAQGYGGPVRVMVGVDGEAAKIVGLKVVAQNETPGLGTRIQEIKSNKTLMKIVLGKMEDAEEETVPWFLRQFQGQWVGSFAQSNGTDAVSSPTPTPDAKIDAITGATISSNAVVSAVTAACTKISRTLAGEGTAAQP